MFAKIILVPLFLFTSLSQAAETLDNIKNTRHITIAYRNAPPFSYKQKNGEVAGYVIDLCRLVINDIEKSIGNQHIDVNYVENPLLIERSKLLSDHKVDMICTVNTGNPNWSYVAYYSVPYAISYTKFVSAQEVKGIDKLQGRTVSVTSGSYDLFLLNKLNREKGLNLMVMTSPTMEGAFKMMSDGISSAAFINDISLQDIVDIKNDKKRYAVSVDSIDAEQKFVILMQKDHELKSIVDNALCNELHSANFDGLYNSWFNSPLPFTNINLHHPLTSQARQELLSSPECKERGR